MAGSTFTLEQLRVLEAAIASGTLEVDYGDKRVIYKTLAEMLQVRDLIRNELGLNNKNRGRRYAAFSKGLNSCGDTRKYTDDI
jgi:hypothetical protein